MLDSWLTRIIFLLFVFASPVGMLLGILLDQTVSEIHLVIIQSFSGGTFIYLSACDLIIHQFHDESGSSKSYLFCKFFSMLTGSLIVIILIATAPTHEH